ncbi:MAG: 2-dehydropantoate 2-reductase [Betaproteobacteria bacterium]|nr:2-dehydropantoate 2-reductase [Betaproteobacteria bacterium]
MNILILGAGGVGGYFGARLIEIGADVHFLVRPQRAERLRSEGLQILSPHGDFRVDAKVMTEEELQKNGPPCEFDLALLSPKAFDLEGALKTLRPAIGARTCLLPLLNGVAHMSRLDELFGRDRVLGGVAHIAATLTPEGAVKQLTPMHILTEGARSPAHEGLAHSFFTLCQRAQFTSVYAENIEQALWDKWTFLATLAGSTTLCRAGVGSITASAEGAAFMRRMYDECLEVAKRSNQSVSDAAQEKALAILMEPGSGFTASMLRDLLSGGRTEHEHILGDMVHRAHDLGIDAPLMGAAYVHMLAESASLKSKGA